MAYLKINLAQIIFGLLFILISLCEANEVVVGGKNGWKTPSSPDEYNKWAWRLRFQVGDYLIFNYDKNVDSVLEVNEEDYKNCNTTKPTNKCTDGSSKLSLDKSGHHYFISGADNGSHCAKGEKLDVVVISQDHGKQKPEPEAPTPSADVVAPPPGIKSGGSKTRLGVFVVFVFVVGLVLV